MSSAVQEAAAERLAGEQPSRTRAFVAAAAVAVATGTLVYRLLRYGGS